MKRSLHLLRTLHFTIIEIMCALFCASSGTEMFKVIFEKMLAHTCESSDIDRKANNYPFLIPCEIDYKNDNFEKFLFRFFMEYYFKV